MSKLALHPAPSPESRIDRLAYELSVLRRSVITFMKAVQRHWTKDKEVNESRLSALEGKVREIVKALRR